MPPNAVRHHFCWSMYVLNTNFVVSLVKELRGCEQVGLWVKNLPRTYTHMQRWAWKGTRKRALFGSKPNLALSKHFGHHFGLGVMAKYYWSYTKEKLAPQYKPTWLGPCPSTCKCCWTALISSPPKVCPFSIKKRKPFRGSFLQMVGKSCKVCAKGDEKRHEFLDRSGTLGSLEA
jgi:hypothetical protein